MLNKTIKKIIKYGEIHLGLSELDATFVHNALLNLFKEVEPFEGDIDEEAIKEMNVPDELVDELASFLNEKGYSVEEVEKLVTQAMGAISPRPQAVSDHFNDLFNSDPKLATEYLYDVSVKNYYVQKTKVDKNILWISKDNLEISINLSKPEKDNKDIRKLFGAKSSGYPKCVLCYENLGFAGKEKFVPRQNIRIAPLKLGGEEWFVQYSPYGYYNRHLIVINKHHIPMQINKSNMSKLFDYVDMFPHQFIGSNSDLPITGGSILNHEHFQGGEHEMPIMKRNVRKEYIFNKFDDVFVGRLDWYNTCLYFESTNREHLLDLGDHIVKCWSSYDDETVEIISHNGEERHNSITPILRKCGDVYKFYILLRNNRTNEKYPGGIFHAHPEYHHIKKEGIGLIEAMGLFILPARLLRQNKTIETILANKLAKKQYLKTYPDLEQFAPMIDELSKKDGDPHFLVQDYIDDVCRHILENTGVFKNNKQGEEAFDRFMNYAGFKAK